MLRYVKSRFSFYEKAEKGQSVKIMNFQMMYLGYKKQGQVV